MLRLYRRHRTACGRRSERYRRCACPIYVEGSLGGERIRRALDYTSWEAASDLIRQWTAAGRIGGSQVVIPSVKDAVGQFLADARARGLKEPSLRKYANVLEHHLLGFCRKKGHRELRHLTVDVLRQWRAGWTLAPRTQQKTLDTLRAFFRFCEAAEWIAKNPASSVRPPKVDDKPTLPLADEDVRKLLHACRRYPGNGRRLRAMILVLRYAGLRISDAVTLKREHVQGDRIFLYQQKTGTPVYVPVPEFVIRAVDALPGREFVFWSGNGEIKSCIEDWRRSFRSLARLAGVQHFHFHRLRDSFAVSLLERGVDIESVATLLGHSSSAITRKHYNPWVQSRQVALEAAVRRAWSPTSPMAAGLKSAS